MELQERYGDFAHAGIAVFAISYDHVRVLAGFAARHDISYPLLSDRGSRVIRSLGLLNTHLEAQAAFYGKLVRAFQRGVPYPGTFVLDAQGTVVAKHFEQSYRVRPQAAALLEEMTHATDAERGVRARARSDSVAATARLAQATYRPYQRLVLRLDLDVAPGLHVYGRPVPDSYTPLEVTIDPLGSLEVGAAAWPAPRPFRITGLDERFAVHEGPLSASVPLVLTRDVGDVTLVARLRYQACSARECFPPEELCLRVPLTALGKLDD